MTILRRRFLYEIFDGGSSSFSPLEHNRLKTILYWVPEHERDIVLTARATVRFSKGKLDGKDATLIGWPREWESEDSAIASALAGLTLDVMKFIYGFSGDPIQRIARAFAEQYDGEASITLES